MAVNSCDSELFKKADVGAERSESRISKSSRDILGVDLGAEGRWKISTRKKKKRWINVISNVIWMLKNNGRCELIEIFEGSE